MTRKYTKRPRAIELQKPATLQLFWHWHDSSNHMRRIWRSDWPGDMFEMIDPTEFVMIGWFTSKFALTITEVAGED